MLSPLLGVFCVGRNPDDGVAPDISDAGVPKSSRPLSSGEPNSPVQSGENRQNASSEEHLGTKISSSSKSTPPSSRGDASQFTDASSLPHFVEDIQASAPDGEDSQWRKRKHPERSRAAEASLELRSDSGLRRRLEPTVLRRSGGGDCTYLAVFRCTYTS
jgi:hypothetical protein